MPDPNELLAEMLAQAGGEDQQGTFPAAVPPLRPQPPPEEPAPDIPMANPVVPRDPLMSLIGEGSRNIPPPPKEPTLKRTKKEMFRDMLSTFVYSLASGLQESRGPGGNARGAAAALLAPYEREIQQHKMALETRRVAAQEAQQRSMEELRQKQELAFERVEVPDFNDPSKTMLILRKDMPAYIGAVQRAEAARISSQTKKETTTATLASKERIEGKKLSARQELNEAQTELAKWRTEAIKQGLDPNSPVFQQKERALQSRIQIAEQGLALRQQSLELAVERMYRPTTGARDRAAFAETLREHIPDIKDQLKILDAQGKLGPIAGRWNDFLTGKIGADDPGYMALRTAISAMTTGLMVPHVGARGGVQLIKKFEAQLNAGKMTRGNLEAALGEWDKFLEGYSRLPEIQLEQSRKWRGVGGAASQATHRWNPATGRVEPIGKR